MFKGELHRVRVVGGTITVCDPVRRCTIQVTLVLRASDLHTWDVRVTGQHVVVNAPAHVNRNPLIYPWVAQAYVNGDKPKFIAFSTQPPEDAEKIFPAEFLRRCEISNEDAGLMIRRRKQYVTKILAKAEKAGVPPGGDARADIERHRRTRRRVHKGVKVDRKSDSDDDEDDDAKGEEVDEEARDAEALDVEEEGGVSPSFLVTTA